MCLPALTNTFITLVQDTALLSVIGVVELQTEIDSLRMGLVGTSAAPWQIYALGAAFYLAICYPLSVLARGLEKRLSTGVATASA